MDFPLEFRTSVAGGRRILTVKGEFDLAVSAAFEQKLLAAVAATRPSGELVADLSKVRFFDAKALRAFLHGARAAQDAGIPFRVAASPAIDRVLALLEVDAERVPGCPTSSPLWTPVPSEV